MQTDEKHSLRDAGVNNRASAVRGLVGKGWWNQDPSLYGFRFAKNKGRTLNQKKKKKSGFNQLPTPPQKPSSVKVLSSWVSHSAGTRWDGLGTRLVLLDPRAPPSSTPPPLQPAPPRQAASCPDPPPGTDGLSLLSLCPVAPPGL